MQFPFSSFPQPQNKNNRLLLRFQIYPAYSVDEKHLMRFPIKSYVFKFLHRSEDGMGSICLTDQNRLKNRHRCVIIYDYKVAHAIFSHIPLTKKDVLAS